MEFTLATAFVRLVGDRSQLKKDLNTAETETGSWTSKIVGSTKAALLGVVAVGATALAGMTVAIGKAVIDVTQDTQQAVRDLQAQFGQTEEEAKSTALIAQQVWKNNFGESVRETAEAVGTVQQKLGELGVTAPADVQRVAEAAFALRDSFEVDVSQSIVATKTLMENFNISYEEALDLITVGFQEGLDSSGDFLDTINEYSPLFAGGGVSASGFFNVLESGLQGGTLGTDKAADAFKEYTLRVMDGSTLTRDALSKLGIDADAFTEQLATGQLSVVDAWGLLKTELAGVEDKSVQAQIGVALFGTQFEDLGVEAYLALTTVEGSFNDVTGSMGTLQEKYGALSFDNLERRAIGALLPIANTVLAIADKALPALESAVNDFFALIQPIIEGVAAGIEEFFSVIEGGGTPLEALKVLLETFLPQDVIDIVWGLIEGLQTLWGQVMILLEPITAFLAENLKLKDVLLALGITVTATLLPAWAAFAAGVVAAAAPIVLGIAALTLVIAGLRYAWENDLGGIRDFAAGIWSAIQAGFAAFKALFSGDFEGFSTQLQEAWSIAWNAVVTFLGNIWTSILPILTGLWTSISAWFAEVDWAALGKMVIDFLAEKLGELYSFVVPKLISFFTSVTAWFAGIDWQALADRIITEMLIKLETFFTGAKPVLEGWWADIKKWFEEIDWGKLAQDILNGIVAVLQASTAIADALWGLMQGAWDAIVDFWENFSPSHRMARLAEDIIRGGTQTFDRDTSLGDSFKAMTESAFNQVALAVPGSGSSVFDQRSSTNAPVYSLTINTPTSKESVVQDFRFLQNWRRT